MIKLTALATLVQTLEKHPVGAAYLIALVALVGSFSLMLVQR